MTASRLVGLPNMMDSALRRVATEADGTLHPLHSGLGMRRVDWVRILISGTAVRCDVHGIGHRLPCRRPLSLDSALALRAAGVPTVIRMSSAYGPPPNKRDDGR